MLNWFISSETDARARVSHLILIVRVVRSVGEGESGLVILRRRQGRGGRGPSRHGERRGGRDRGDRGVGGALPRAEPLPHVIEGEHGEGGRGGEHAGVQRAGRVTERSPTLKSENC